jgi:hypothetical protein
MKRLILPPLALLALAGGSALADDVSGARYLLCSVVDVHFCLEAAGCVETVPEELNIPRFIHIDTKTHKLSTTPSSGENRETVADHLVRENGQLTIQGVEDGRAFSLFVHESTGLATFASAAENVSVTLFGACTPTSEK